MSPEPAPAPLTAETSLVAVPLYAGINDLELGLMLTVGRLCGGEGAVCTVNRSRASIVTAGGLVCTPQVLYAALPRPSALLLAGGSGAAKFARDPLLRGFLQAHAALPVGACGSGLLLAGEAGLLRDRQIGVGADLAELAWSFDPGDVQSEAVCHDGTLLTGPGGLRGLEVVLGIAAQVWGEAPAREAARQLGAH